MVFDYFTPVRGIVGGALIGTAATTLLLFDGIILGASGLVSSFVVSPKSTLMDEKNQWKLLFIVAFFITSRIYLLIDPSALDDTRTGLDPAVPIVSPLGFLIGGFLVGFGTRLGNGCTTGHGICGMARMSLRSFVAVGCFMFTGILFASTFPVTNQHLRDTSDSVGKYEPTLATNIVVTSIIAIVALFALVGLARNRANGTVTYNRFKYLAASTMASIIFAVGLIVSQMTFYSKIFGFLDFSLIPSGRWDPTLIMVMGGGFAVSLLSYQWVDGFNVVKNSHALQCPLSQQQSSEEGSFDLPTNKIIDYKLVLGELTFGLGWGIAGLCPGPAMVRGAAGYPNVLFRWWPMFFVGALLAEKLKPFFPKIEREPTVAPQEDNTETDTKMEGTESLEGSGKTLQSKEDYGTSSGDAEAVV